MADINLSQISKSFGDMPVLKGVDLDVRDGEFVTLVGPSGCGKSTLLRILAGLEAADGGRVVIDGRDVSTVRPAARNLAMVFQSYALYPHLTVAQNMATPLKMRDLTRMQRLPVFGPLLAREAYRRISEQVKKTADILKIEPLLARKPGQLSGGQRQRAALGRAMVREPQAFLMDEPLSNLDAALRVHMRTELTELHRRLKTTFVYVTHDQAEALTMSDRMAVMMGGRILQFDRPDEIYRNPNSLDVARFIGSPAINILPGEIDTAGRLSLFGVVIGQQFSGPRRPVSIGLRPEDLSVATQSNDGLPALVTHRENLGSDIYLHVVLGGTERRVTLRATPEQGRAFGIGAALNVVAKPGAALVFEADDTRASAQATRLVEVV